jgi:RNA polymerase sigma-54 factor
MTLLEMTAVELSQKIDTELSKNPALELVEERRCPSCRQVLVDPGPCSICSKPKTNSEEPIVFVSSSSDHYDSTPSNWDYSSQDTPDDNIAPVEELSIFVLRQIAADLTVEDRPIAAHILTELDEDGLLLTSSLEISRYHHVPISRVENIIQQIKKAEPIGVGSATPQEALLTQLEVLKEIQMKVHPLAEIAIREGMSFLSRHQFGELAELLGSSLDEAKDVAHFIGSNLNPYPARAHWGNVRQGNDSQPQVYHQPDIIISKLGDDPDSALVVEILIPTRGTLRINPLFRKSIKEAPEDKIDKWKQDIENANLLIKCIQQRNNTMQRLMRYLAAHQRDFIISGEKYLRPTTRAYIANELGVHESTISRAVAGKSLQLPNNKIIPLKQLFDQSLHIRAHIKEFIKEEKKALTDSQLASLLKKKDYIIARRTVAKYRAMEGILPAHMRKNLAVQ